MRANASRPSGGEYLPGRVASSDSKFWKQGVKPNESQYSCKSGRTASRLPGLSAGAICKLPC